MVYGLGFVLLFFVFGEVRVANYDMEVCGQCAVESKCNIVSGAHDVGTLLNLALDSQGCREALGLIIHCLSC